MTDRTFSMYAALIIGYSLAAHAAVAHACPFCESTIPCALRDRLAWRQMRVQRTQMPVRALSPVLCGIALRGGRCVCNAPKCLLDTSALRFYYTLMRCKVASCLEKNPGSIVL